MNDTKNNLPKSYDQLAFYVSLLVSCLIATLTFWLLKNYENLVFILNTFWFLLAFNYQKEISDILKHIDDFETKFSNRIHSYESQLKSLEQKQTLVKFQLNELQFGDD